MPIKIIRFRRVRCAGCGKLDTIFCPYCLELHRAARMKLKKIEKNLNDTLAGKFSIRAAFKL